MKLTSAGAFVQIKDVAPNSPVVTVFILHHDAVGKMPVSFKNAMDDTVKIIYFIKNQPLSTGVFNIL